MTDEESENDMEMEEGIPHCDSTSSSQVSQPLQLLSMSDDEAELLSDHEPEAEPQMQTEEKFERLAEGAEFANFPFDNDLHILIIANILNKSLQVACKAMRIVERLISSQIQVEEMFLASEQIIQRMKTECHLKYDEPTSNHLLNILLCRCEEERVNLKRASILTIQALLLSINHPIECIDASVEKLRTKCRDLALSIRKISAQALTRLLLKMPNNERLRTAWLHSVMNLVVDREPTVGTFCSKLIFEVLIDPILQNSEHDEIVWHLLYVIEQEADLRRLLVTCLHSLHQEKILSSRLVKVLCEKQKIPRYSNACWMLLAEISVFMEVPPNYAIDIWEQTIDLNASDRLIGFLSKVVANRVKSMSFQQRNYLKCEISKALIAYRVDASYVASVYYAYARIIDGIGPQSKGYRELENWNRDFYQQCVRDLDNLVYFDTPMLQFDDYESERPATSQKSQLTGSQAENSDKLIRIISSLGECVQYTPTLINRELFKLLQVIIPSDVLKKVHNEQLRSIDPTPRVFSPNTTFNTILPGSQSHHTSEFDYENDKTGLQMRFKHRAIRCELLTRSVRAYAVLTLGKLCLLDEQLAKKCIPVFIRELKNNKDHTVRNNIVIVVCDLCIGNTSLVDRYSTILASCLWDHSVLIRQHTLLLLTNLIKEHYLKWEGMTIYRYVVTLFDSDLGIREYADFCLKEVLFPHFKEEIFFHRFVECLFHFNGVRTIIKDDFELSAQIDRKCSLEGRDKEQARMYLYKYMIKTFEDVQKIKILEKLGYDVFLAVIEGTFKLSDVKVRSLLYDSFQIIRTQEIKLSLQLGKRDIDDERDDEEPPDEVKKAAKHALGTTFRRSITELVMPRLIGIRSFLVERRSPLAKECYAAILEFCKDHVDFIDDFLYSDSQLRAEIKFDLKRQHNEQH